MYRAIFKVFQGFKKMKVFLPKMPIFKVIFSKSKIQGF